MKLGAYTACLHDRPLPETLKILQELGLTSAEINAGGFIPAPHLPIGQVLSSTAAREARGRHPVLEGHRRAGPRGRREGVHRDASA
jgi:sugar phosphate isomerase/epimerase